jgi:ribosomal protein L19
MKEKMPSFSIGDTLKVHTKVTEGDRVRTQSFTGVLIARKGGEEGSRQGKAPQGIIITAKG